jgi:hypothetical protein
LLFEALVCRLGWRAKIVNSHSKIANPHAEHGSLAKTRRSRDESQFAAQCQAFVQLRNQVWACDQAGSRWRKVEFGGENRCGHGTIICDIDEKHQGKMHASIPEMDRPPTWKIAWWIRKSKPRFILFFNLEVLGYKLRWSTTSFMVCGSNVFL